MREPLTAERLDSFIKALAAEARTSGQVYLVGGASAVLLGWRTASYPALDARTFRAAVERVVREYDSGE